MSAYIVINKQLSSAVALPASDMKSGTQLSNCTKMANYWREIRCCG